ncbi:oligosaccharide flippase family protein [Robbsia sp. KACC 23696]|uniref:oligosaccharide flippase family protein n=1 Tax=Robbsia sp. KACC 23696 TaxID=3149231 RepID=UPI00325B55DA
MKKIYNIENIGKITRNLFWLFVERGGQFALAIIISGMLARGLGPDDFGKWQYANSILLIISPLTWVCGAEILVPLMVRSLAENGKTRVDNMSIDSIPAINDIIGTAFVIRLIASIFVVFVSGLVVVLFGQRSTVDPVVSNIFFGFLGALLFREPFAVFTAWLQARTHSRPALLVSLIAAVMKTVLLYIFIKFSFSTKFYSSLWAFESIVVAVGLCWIYVLFKSRRPIFLVNKYYKYNVENLKCSLKARFNNIVKVLSDWNFRTEMARDLLLNGAVFWVALIFYTVFLKIDRIILQRYVGYDVLGQYGAAQQITENWITMALMIAQTVAPIFIFGVVDRKKLRRNIAVLSLIVTIFMSLGAIIISYFSTDIIRLVFGGKFVDAARYLTWSTWIAVLVGIQSITSQYLLKFQMKGSVLFKWCIAFLAAIIFDIILIPIYGGYGALLGVASGYLVALIIDIFVICFTFKRV